MKRLIRLLLVASLAITTLSARPALAWGDYGHRVIAQIAEANVSPKVRARIRALLAQEKQLATPECPLRTIEDASVWADCIRRDDLRWGYTAPWHYQNIDTCKDFSLDACRDGNCVSAQIDRNFALLKNKKLPDHVRLEALAFLVHFVGDLHQPLHAGDRNDRGGNDVKANFGIIPGANLHWIWDGLIAERPLSAQPNILRIYTGAERSALAGGTSEDWSREAWALSRDIVYARAYDAAPCGPVLGEIPGGLVTIDEADVAASRDTVRLQIQRAGLRLARLLGEALA